VRRRRDMVRRTRAGWHNVYTPAMGIESCLTSAAPPLLFPALGADGSLGGPYERYLLDCSDYLRRQMMIYEHWPQRRYDVLGYRKEKVFADMNC